MKPSADEIQKAEKILGLKPADIDLIVALRDGNEPEIERLLAICRKP